mmetsp:Transcript_17227/g.30978  ORF Transcript_17227/g.30978 Transcript_17227/m.30978 type:complete len:80 (-) Transcript_17227:2202-2441(-)
MKLFNGFKIFLLVGTLITIRLIHILKISSILMMFPLVMLLVWRVNHMVMLTPGGAGWSVHIGSPGVFAGILATGLTVST